MPEPTISPLSRTREQLDALLRTRTGSLVDTSYPILLLALAVHDRSAVLTLTRNPLQKEILFEAGSPVDCRSNIATETLGRFLVNAGKLSEQDAHMATSLAAARQVPLEEVLTERKLLAPTEVYRVLQQSLGRKLLEPFSWKSGTYEISHDVPAAESSLRVKVPQLIITGTLKIEAQETADEVVAIAAGKSLAIASDPLFPLEELRLSAEQQKIVDAAKRGTKFEDIRATCGIPVDDFNRVVYALLLLGMLTVVERPSAGVPFFDPDASMRLRGKTAPGIEPPVVAPPPPPPPPPPAIPAVAPPAPPPPPPPPPAAVPRTLAVEPALAEEIMSAYLSYRRKDAFDLLGVPELAGPTDFIKAFLRMAEKFLPSKFDEKAPDGLRDKAQEVFLAAARAYAELADPERRDAIVKKRIQKRDHAAAAVTAPVPSAPKAAADRPASRSGMLDKGGMIDPDALWKSGREMSAAGKLREALSYYEMAADCDAQNGTYAAEVAFCRFELMISPAASALKALKNAIRIDPKSGVAYLYAGRVQAALGNKIEAEAYINRAGTLIPRDPRVAEALKALR